MRRMFTVLALLLAYTISTNGQNQNRDQVLRYIERYRNLAMSEQQRTGIPAAIKLAQGIQETGAGTSELATKANNHFGLKCKSDWTGPTFEHRDNRRKECFRKYNMDFESWQDQSDYLKSTSRYASLFRLSITDYAGWAFGLSQAGYATNPQYAQSLIKLIEDYRLQEYTYAAMGKTSLVDNNVAAAQPAAPANNRSRSSTTYDNNYNSGARRNNSNNNRSSYGNNYNAQPTTTPPGSSSWYGNPSAATTTDIDNTPPQRTSEYIDTKPRRRQTILRSRQNGRTTERTVDDAPNKVVKVNNLKAVYAKRGDMPLQYAVRNGIRYEKFLEMNDLEDAPLTADMPLYLERKHFWGIRPMHLVKPGETMVEIAQEEGIQLKYLRDLNYMEEDEEPVPGITLELQAQAGKKPKVVKHTEVQQNNEAYTQQSEQPTSVFPKNPAPVHQEEKNIFEKIKEAREARRREKAGLPPKGTAATKPSSQQPAAQQQPAQQPVAQQQPVQQAAQQRQPVQQQQQTTSYSRQQYSYTNTNRPVTPNPAAQVYNDQNNEEDDRELSRKERRQLKKQQEEEQERLAQQPVQKTAPQPQRPKTELDKLKEQFDNVIYTDGSKNSSANAGQQPTQYKRPQQQYGRPSYQQQNNTQNTQQYGRQQSYQQNNTQYQAQNNSRYGQQQYNNNGYNNRQQYNGNQQQGQQQYRDPNKYYTVKQGDTAYTIAKKHGITIRQLMDMNGLDFDQIKEGQNLRVKP